MKRTGHATSAIFGVTVITLTFVLAPLMAQGATQDNEGAILELLARYERAIEEQSVELFQSVKPNLSEDERARLQRSFDSIHAHAVELTVVSIEVDGSHARAVIRRRDKLNPGSASEVVQSFAQTLSLARSGDHWGIETIGR